MFNWAGGIWSFGTIIGAVFCLVSEVSIGCPYFFPTSGWNFERRRSRRKEQSSKLDGLTQVIHCLDTNCCEFVFANLISSSMFRKNVKRKRKSWRSSWPNWKYGKRSSKSRKTKIKIPREIRGIGKAERWRVGFFVYILNGPNHSLFFAGGVGKRGEWKLTRRIFQGCEAR